jgi:hypothetical protein
MFEFRHCSILDYGNVTIEKNVITNVETMYFLNKNTYYRSLSDALHLDKKLYLDNVVPALTKMKPEWQVEKDKMTLNKLLLRKTVSQNRLTSSVEKKIVLTVRFTSGELVITLEQFLRHKANSKWSKLRGLFRFAERDMLYLSTIL